MPAAMYSTGSCGTFAFTSPILNRPPPLVLGLCQNVRFRLFPPKLRSLVLVESGLDELQKLLEPPNADHIARTHIAKQRIGKLKPTETIRAFETLFPDLRQGYFQVRQRNLSDFPLWLRSAVALYTLDRVAAEQPAITYVLARESALSEFSDLNAPKALTIATTPTVNREMRSNAIPYGDFGGPGVYIQVWKEDPRLFAIDNNINPIELYLSMRDNPDERIQIALQAMLSRYELPLMEEK